MKPITLKSTDFDELEQTLIDVKASSLGVTRDVYIQMVIERELVKVCDGLLEGLLVNKKGTISQKEKVH